MLNKPLNILLKDIIDDQMLSTLSEISVSHIELDSRLITNNGLFIALNGTQTDGRLYIQSAIKQGAVAVLVDDSTLEINKVENGIIPVIKVTHLNSHLSNIASRFYDFPQNDLSLIGITGTNGKTTVNQLIGQWLTLLGEKVYCMGTLGNGMYNHLVDSPNTTLNALDLVAHLAKAKELNADYVVMEVSSHGLSLDRVKSLHFDVAAFTNLSQDHLDFHGSMQAYGDAKLQLFTPEYSKKMVLNASDDLAKSWINHWQEKQESVDLCCFNQSSVLANININAIDVIYSNKGISGSLVINEHIYKLESKLLGEFNLDNLLTALGCMYSAGFDIETLISTMPTLSPVMGRMEVFTNDKSPCLVVDYAHTPDALKQALLALRVHCEGRLWVVFGCGGDRDNTKRPLMASMAEQYADRVIFTQDNSRSENPSTIFAQMLEGIENKDAITIEYERTTAIKYAAKNADINDIILLAGKGHENYQILQSGRIDYDERALALEVVNNL